MQTRQSAAGGMPADGTPERRRARPAEPGVEQASVARHDADRLLDDLTRDVAAWAGEERLPDVGFEALLLGPHGRWPWPAEVGAGLLAARRRGRRVRVLTCPDPAGPRAARPAPDLEGAGAHVRTTAAPLPPLLLLDGTAAAVPRASGDGSVAIVRDPMVVRLLYHFAEIHWSDAVPSGARTRTPGGEAVSHGQLQQRILQLLAEGAKDETVARTLGISVRTCRRHIAEILIRLGAVSRFQAGVNARHAGLLPPGGPGAPVHPGTAGGILPARWGGGRGAPAIRVS